MKMRQKWKSSKKEIFQKVINKCKQANMLKGNYVLS